MSETQQNCVYNCANCNKIYKRANGLLKHNKTCIPKEKVMVVPDNNDTDDTYDSTPDTSHCLTPKKINDAINYHEFLENCDGPVDLNEFVKMIIMQIIEQKFSLGNTREEISENILRIKNSLKSSVERMNVLIEEKRVARLMQHKENNKTLITNKL